MTKKIKVILLEDVRGRGNKGDIIEVAPAFAQNVLYPQNKAKKADSASLHEINEIKAKKQKEKEKYIDEINKLLVNINEKGGLKFEKQATELNKLYDKIDEKYLLNHIMTEYGVRLNKGFFVIDNPIDHLGEHEVVAKFEGKKIKLKITVQKK